MFLYLSTTPVRRRKDGVTLSFDQLSYKRRGEVASADAVDGFRRQMAAKGFHAFVSETDLGAHVRHNGADFTVTAIVDAKAAPAAAPAAS